METLALLLVAPLVWPFIAKAIWKHELTLPEMAANIAVGVLIVVSGFFLSRYAAAYDIEILNGQVTSKAREQVSCEHDYKCRCRQVCTGTGKNRSCSEQCDTCYEHSYDYDWMLRTTVGSIEVNRVDRQGTTEPPRFSRAQAGDPVAKSNSYTNYIKAAPDSLFNTLADQKALSQFAGKVPAYPANIYDYHYLDRVLALGVNVPDVASWNRKLAEALRQLGPTRQVNIVLVLTAERDPQFADAIRAAWLGGKKNDVVVVLGVGENLAIDWARVVSWTDNELFKVQLRDELAELKTLERDAVLELITKHVAAGFKRKPMADFEYLKDRVAPPMWLALLLAALGLVASIVTSVVLSRNMVRSGPSFGGLNRRFR